MSHIDSGCFGALGMGFHDHRATHTISEAHDYTATFTQGAWVWCESLLKILGNLIRFLLGF